MNIDMEWLGDGPFLETGLIDGGNKLYSISSALACDKRLGALLQRGEDILDLAGMPNTAASE